MALRDTEQIVQHALAAGLVGPDKRRLLLDGLPMGFIYSLPTVSRPIDQLRFDLMELSRTPRLIGLPEPPLAVWLQNAIELTKVRWPDTAEVFAEAADRLLGGDRVRSGLRAAQGEDVPSAVSPNHAAPARPVASASATAASTSAAPATHPVDRPWLVLTINPDAEDAWRKVTPRIDPEGRHYVVASQPGAWHKQHGPHSPAWRRWVESLDLTLGDIAEDARTGDALAIFAQAPHALGALLGARLHDRLSRVDAVTVFQYQRHASARWRPWGPAWSRPVEPRDEPWLHAGIRTDREAADVALVVALSVPIHEDRLTRPLAEASRSPIPRVVVEPDRRQTAELETPTDIETAARDLRVCVKTMAYRMRRLERLHLFYTGPLALMIRLGDILAGHDFGTTVYHHHGDDGYTPSVMLGGGRPARLVSLPDLAALPGRAEYDAFIAFASADAEFAETLYEALAAERLSVFLDRRSLEFGDAWDEAIPAALARSRVVVVLISPHTPRAWFQSEEILRAIDHLRERDTTRRVVPVLLSGVDPKEVPYGLRRLHGLTVSRHQTPYEVARDLVPVIERS